MKPTRVIINPPYENNNLIKFTLQALNYLEPGGKLVIIMPTPTLTHNQGGMIEKSFIYPSINYDQAVMRAYQRLLVRKISVYPDLMTAAAISQLTGYSKKTVLTWASLGMIHWFKNAQQQYAPKELEM